MLTVIIVPCYNEAERINIGTFVDFSREHRSIHFLFVNDGSTDSTAVILDNIAHQMPDCISVIHLEKNCGKADAVRQGFLKSFTMNPDVVGFIDADLATPLECIPEFVEALLTEKKEIVIGARVALLGRVIERNSIRHYAGRFFATAASTILGVRIYDTQCGAKIFRVTDRLKEVFAMPFTVSWIFDVEIFARFIILERKGLPKISDICLEYPLKKWVDKKGSKIRPIDFLISGIDLLKIFLLLQKIRFSNRKNLGTE